MNWEAAYIGAPFAKGGRGPRAFDCWGLVCEVYARHLGISLPLHDEIGTGDHRRVALQMQQSVGTAPWVRVEDIHPFDVMVARRDPHSRYPGHVGVMLDATRVLHVWEGRDVHISRVREPSLAGLILGYYRHGSQP